MNNIEFVCNDKTKYYQGYITDYKDLISVIKILQGYEERYYGIKYVYDDKSYNIYDQPDFKYAEKVVEGNDVTILLTVKIVDSIFANTVVSTIPCFGTSEVERWIYVIISKVIRNYSKNKIYSKRIQ